MASDPADSVVMGDLLGNNPGILCTVTVVSKEGSTYVFPDVVEQQLRDLLPETGRVLEIMPSLMLVNMSVSVISIPFQIISTISIGEEELWAAPL